MNYVKGILTSFLWIVVFYLAYFYDILVLKVVYTTLFTIALMLGLFMYFAATKIVNSLFITDKIDCLSDTNFRSSIVIGAVTCIAYSYILIQHQAYNMLSYYLISYFILLSSIINIKKQIKRKN